MLRRAPGENAPKGKEWKLPNLDVGSEDKAYDRKLLLKKKKKSQPEDRRIKVLFGEDHFVQIMYIIWGIYKAH